jgi:glycosyltransferase involved in cell wall biosynthesis
MKKHPKFSIITPSLNSAKFIEDAINSLFNQDYDNLEHIIIDGGSTDRTIHLLSNYPHLKIISESDNGIYDAMNKGIKIAKGEIIGILNSDDWYEPNILKKVLNIFNSYPDVGVVHGDMLEWKNNKIYRKNRFKSYQQYYCMWVKHPTCFVRKAIYDQYGPFNIKYELQADYDLMLRFKKNGVQFYYMPSVLTNFRIGGYSSKNWSLRESIEVRTRNNMMFSRAMLAAVTVRSIFKIKIMFNNFWGKIKEF